MGVEIEVPWQRLVDTNLPQITLSAASLGKLNQWGHILMKKLLFALVVSALPVHAMTTTARADDDEGGRIAAGVAGGILGGVLGGALAPRPYYAPRYYYGPPRGYVDDAPRCYWTRGEPVWDGYYGVWRRHHVRVCE